MNLKEIEYIVKIAEERNVTRAAKKLFLTPSALNQQLLHLEREIGTPLFFRSRTGWSPTEAGEVYLSAAREMLRLKRETYHRLQDITDAKKGSLSIGFPPERGAHMFTSIYPVFHKEYPGIVINVSEVSVRRQQQMIIQGSLDIGFMTLQDNQRTDDEYLPISTEELVLAVPSVHPLCSQAKPGGKGPYPELDLEGLKYEPFALMYRESTIRQWVDTIFRQAGFVPNVLFETARARTILHMVGARMCCGLVPESDTLALREDVSYFCLPDHPSWKIVASYRKNSYLSSPTMYLVQLASQYWQDPSRVSP